MQNDALCLRETQEALPAFFHEQNRFHQLLLLYEYDTGSQRPAATRLA
jgi:hypothetical protein